MISSSVAPSAFAMSATVAARPSSIERRSTARLTARFSSWSRRGTLTAHPLSRKCRFISPTIVGVAYVVNSTPRSTSKRSIALMRPTVPTWIRSSIDSPRFAKRTARKRTSLRCATTSSSRILGSRSPANWANIARILSRWNRSSGPFSLALLRMRSGPDNFGERQPRSGYLIRHICHVVHQRSDEEDAESAGRGEFAGRSRFRGSRRPCAGSSDGDRDPPIVEDALDVDVAATGVLDAAIACLGDGELEILDVLDRKTGSARDARGREPRDSDPLGKRRNADGDRGGAVLRRGFGVLQRLSHAAFSESYIPKIFDRPVMSKIFLI